MTRPDPALMQQSREMYARMVALADRQLHDEAKEAEREAIRLWMRALGKPEAVRGAR